MSASDSEVIGASVADPVRFGEIFDRHVDEIRKYVQRRLDHDRSADVVAEVFRIAFEQRASFDPAAESARPWLYGIAANCLRRAHRGHARRRSALARVRGRRDTDVDPLVGVADRIDAGNESRHLADALRYLSDDEREVLLLVAWEQLTPTEIARAQGVPPETVRTRLHRARRHVRDRLARVADIEEAGSHAN